MILESVEVINKRIDQYYGDLNSQSKFRVVWSNDQTERALSDITPEGLQLLHPRVITRKKYNYIKDRYILERLTPVPEPNQSELGLKLSYEPLWIFEDNNGNALPPSWDVIVILLNTLAEQIHNAKGTSKYKMEDKDKNTFEALEDKAKDLEKVMFGNESSIGDALSVGSAVGYGSNERNDTRFNHNPLGKG